MRRSPATAPGRRRTLFRRRAGEGPAAVVRDECAPCAARHSERSGADCGKSLRGGRFSARDVPGPAAGSGRTSGSGRPGRMCALCSAAFRKERRRLREIPPRRRLFRTGCPRNLPGSRRTSGSGGRRRVRKTAGSRKIDENLIFGTRAFVFYPLSLAAPKILRLNKIANKFAFVSGLFVSLRLKPKYANRP